MKTEKYYLILTVVIGILCAPALGEVELSGPDVALLDQANPALAGIEQLYVDIMPPDSEPNKDGLVWKELRATVESKLKKAGLKYVKPRSLPTPHLRVHIDMLKLSDLQKYVFRIQTSLVRTAILPGQQNVHLQADVWKVPAVMQAASAQSMPAALTNLVLEQVEAFIAAYLAANPQDIQMSDVNDVNAVLPTTQKQLVKPAAKPTVAEYKYVASKNSKVFHKPECSSAKRIKPENLVGYNSRGEAINAAKRPCKRCKP